MVFGLNMSSFVQGAMEQHMDNARERRATEAAQVQLDAENAKELAASQMDLITSLVSDDKLTGIQGAKFAQQVKLGDATFAKILAAAKTVDDIENTEKYGDYSLSLVQPYDFDSMSSFDRSEVFWSSWNRQLAKQGNYQEAVDYFSKNEQARDFLANAVKGNEFELRLGNINRQKKANIETSGLEYINLQEKYGFATRLFDELGFKNVDEEFFPRIAEEIGDDYDPETQVPLMLNTRETGGAITPIAVAVDKNKYAILTEMSKNMGYNSVQQMAFNTSYAPGSRPSGMNDEQFARHQNRVLMKAVDLYSGGFQEFLSNPATMSPEKSAELLEKLQKAAPKDKDMQIRIMSLMVKTPANIFHKVRQKRYSNNETQRYATDMTGQEFVEMLTGLDSNDFDEGLRAQRDAVQYLDQLEKLEIDIAQQLGTGWVARTAAFAARFGIQLQTVPTAVSTLSTVFSSSSDFSALADDTELSDLQATIERVGISGTLQDLSVSDSLRLTLAAKMARAVDPAGRLSNQDFEVQLRRLGTGNFLSAEEIVEKIRTVRKEFEKDLAFKNRLNNVKDNKTGLTPQTAREVQASLTLRNMEGLVYGASGQEQIAGSQATQTQSNTQTQQTTLPAGQTLPQYTTPNGTVTSYYGPIGNQFFLDPQGTQPADPAQFMKDTKGK